MEKAGANVVGLWKHGERKEACLGNIKDRVGGGSAPPDKVRCVSRVDLCDYALTAAYTFVSLSLLP